MAPNDATNAQIVQGTGITSQQGVYMTTQHLLEQGRIRAERAGRSWLFFSVEVLDLRLYDHREGAYSCSQPDGLAVGVGAGW